MAIGSAHPRPPTPAEALCRLLDAAYEKRSLILTSNLHPARSDTTSPKAWPQQQSIGCSATPTVIVTGGRSHRLTEVIECRGVARFAEGPPHR